MSVVQAKPSALSPKLLERALNVTRGLKHLRENTNLRYSWCMLTIVRLREWVQFYTFAGDTYLGHFDASQDATGNKRPQLVKVFCRR